MYEVCMRYPVLIHTHALVLFQQERAEKMEMTEMRAVKVRKRKEENTATQEMVEL
jgi:hypothetical protein